MKVNLTKPASGLNGKPLKDHGDVIMMNRFLANTISLMDSIGDPLQKYELAVKLYDASNDIEIAESEKIIIKHVCESGKMPIIIAAQILNIINNAK